MRNRSPLALPALLSFPLAALLAACAAGGIFLPAVYAREHPNWAAQGLGQDWVDLVLVVPLLAVLAYRTLEGGRVAALMLGGTLAYTLYSLVLYAFFLHFGPLFVVYAWALGLAFYALVALVVALRLDDVRAWFGPGTPVRLAGGFAVVVGALFSVLWLSEVVPAMAAGAMLKSAQEAGLITNPVQVLDLGIVLPAFVIGGVALMRGQRLGYWLGTMMLTFGVVMDVALVGMAVSMAAHHVGAGGPPLGLLVAMPLATASVLALLLRHVSSHRPGM